MKSAISKLAQAMALFMIVSILVPVIAFGASFGFKSFSYDKTSGTVTATVYSDVYESLQGSVFLNVYAPDGTSVLKSVYHPASTETVSGVTYLTFNTDVAANVYGAVYLHADYNSDSVRVYATDAYPDPAGCTSYCGGGGWAGGYNPPTSSINVSASGEINSETLKNALAAHKNVELKLLGDKVLVPASALVDAAGKAGAMLTIITDHGSYMLPLSVLDLDALAKSLGIEVKELIIEVSLTKVTGDTAQSIAEAAKLLGGTPLTAAVDFQITAIGKDGKKLEINDFNTYVARTLTVDRAIDSRKATGVLYNDITKSLSFVPTIFHVNENNTEATLKRNSNSIYTVVQFDKSFSDIAAHWSQADVTLLTNKLVVDGVTDSTFEPDRSITRAEFAALVVRSLGLNAGASASTPFKDVASSDWYSSVVGAAAKAKIIDGYEDGTFRPDQSITREELAAMVVRALKYAGVSTDLSSSNQAALLDRFEDSGLIIWAHKEIAAAIDAGIINGLTDTTIGSNKLATRAESATMLKRFLTRAGFMN